MYQTKDLCLATTLSYFGFVIQKIDKQDPRRATFIFEDSEEIQKLEKQYWADEITVEPNRFNRELRNIKARLYN